MTLFFRFILFYTSALMIFSGCKSTTLIQSSPSGARVYINNEYKGMTPLLYSDRKMTGSVTDLKIEKEGFDPFVYRLKRDEKVDGGAIFCGYFTILPFLWIMEYNPARMYELKPFSGLPKDTLTPLKSNMNIEANKLKASGVVNDKFALLRDIKNLLDAEILNESEYNTIRKYLTENNPSRKKIKYQDITQLNELSKLLHDNIIKQSEFELEKAKILELDKGFEIGEQVLCVLQNGQKVIGQIKEFKNDLAIVEYNQKYLFGSTIQQSEVFVSKISKVKK
jgi:hypothetical protein